MRYLIIPSDNAFLISVKRAKKDVPYAYIIDDKGLKKSVLIW